MSPVVRFSRSPLHSSAPSNIAVDQLTEKIHKTGLKVVRLCAKSREQVSTSVDFLTLHNLVLSLAEQKKDELFKLILLRSEVNELSVKDEKRFKALRSKAERDILSNADVICCTCVGAGDPRLTGFVFKSVLVDEATQATEPECLIPIVRSAKQVVLVGDHCQLPPVIMCKQAAQAGLGRSLFERLLFIGRMRPESGLHPIRLEVQYRMHPCLSEFPSNMFYDGALQNGVTKQDREKKAFEFAWPIPEKPMFFYVSMGTYASSFQFNPEPLERARLRLVPICLLMCRFLLLLLLLHSLSLLPGWQVSKSLLATVCHISIAPRRQMWKKLSLRCSNRAPRPIKSALSLRMKDSARTSLLTCCVPARFEPNCMKKLKLLVWTHFRAEKRTGYVFACCCVYARVVIGLSAAHDSCAQIKIVTVHYFKCTLCSCVCCQIVMSCVRSNEHQGIGFLADPRRMNVALTRAKFGLIILGNAKILSKHPLWNSLLNHFKANDCLVEGALNNLKQSHVKFERPSQHFNKRMLLPTELPQGASIVDVQRQLEEQGYGRRFRETNEFSTPIPTAADAAMPFGAAPMMGRQFQYSDVGGLEQAALMASIPVAASGAAFAGVVNVDAALKPAAAKVKKSGRKTFASLDELSTSRAEHPSSQSSDAAISLSNLSLAESSFSQEIDDFRLSQNSLGGH